MTRPDPVPAPTLPGWRGRVHEVIFEAEIARADVDLERPVSARACPGCGRHDVDARHGKYCGGAFVVQTPPADQG